MDRAGRGGRWYRGAPLAYREVDPPSRLVFAIGGEDDLAIVTLSTVDDHTVMTFEGAAPADEADAVEQRWSELLDRLADSGRATPAGTPAASGPG